MPSLIERARVNQELYNYWSALWTQSYPSPHPRANYGDYINGFWGGIGPMVLGIVPEPRRDAFSVFIIIRDRPDMDTVTALQELIEGATAVGYEDVQRIEVDSCAGTSMRVVLHSAAAGWALLGALKWRLEDGSRDIQAFRVSNIINS